MQINTEQAATAVDKAVTMLHGVIDDAAGKAHAASNEAARAGNLATEWVANRGEKLTAAPIKLFDDASGYVAANPVKSVAIAFFAALAVSRLMR